MGNRRFLSLCLVLGSLALHPVAAPPALWADDAYYLGSGYDVYPVEHADIQLLAEAIVISPVPIDRRKAAAGPFLGNRVEVDMTFRNTGAAASVQMGFPIFLTADPVREIDTGFQTWVDGKEVKVVRKRGIPNPINPGLAFSDAVFTYSVFFKPGATRKIRHSYCVGGGGTSRGDATFIYILRSGALWKGVIKDFSLVYKTRVSNLPYYIGFQPREQEIEREQGDEVRFTWRFRDFEPKRDFVVKRHAQRKLDPGLLAANISWCLRREFADRPAMDLRYLKNWILASYGYPFKNILVRAQFYSPGSPFKEDPSFSRDRMTREHLACVESLTQAEKAKRLEEE